MHATKSLTPQLPCDARSLWLLRSACKWCVEEGEAGSRSSFAEESAESRNSSRVLQASTDPGLAATADEESRAWLATAAGAGATEPAPYPAPAGAVAMPAGNTAMATRARGKSTVAKACNFAGCLELHRSETGFCPRHRAQVAASEQLTATRRQAEQAAALRMKKTRERSLRKQPSETGGAGAGAGGGAGARRGGGGGDIDVPPPPPPASSGAVAGVLAGDAGGTRAAEDTAALPPATDAAAAAAAAAANGNLADSAVCPACRKPLPLAPSKEAGDALGQGTGGGSRPGTVYVFGQTFHAACYACSSCQAGLGGQPAFDHEGKLFCKPCREELLDRCATCGKPITDRYVTLGGRKYHPDCLVCSHCQKRVTQALCHEGSVYCDTHYAELFAKRCAGCQRPILGNFVSLNDDVYHKECFSCTNCSKSLVGQPLYPHDDDFFCQDCYGTLFSAKCGGCGKPCVEGAILSVKGKKWHADCFVCNYCEEPLWGGGGGGDSGGGGGEEGGGGCGGGAGGSSSTSRFYENEGRYYCKPCNSDLFLNKCGGCGFSIEGRELQALGKSWHEECFCCTTCNRSAGESSKSSA